MGFPLPNLSTPPLASDIVPFEQVWARFMLDLHNAAGKDAATALAASAGTVLKAALVADPALVLSAAGATYSQTWADEVTASIAEIKANQIALLAALKASGAMSNE